MLRRVGIKTTLYGTEVEVEGRKLNGVRKIKIEQEVGQEIPLVELEVITHELGLEIEEGDVKFSFPNGWVKVEECKPMLGESVLALVRDKNGYHQEVLSLEHIEENDAVYEGDYWCSYRTMNIEALGISKVVAWQRLPKEDV